MSRSIRSNKEERTVMATGMLMPLLHARHTEHLAGAAR